MPEESWTWALRTTSARRSWTGIICDLRALDARTGPNASRRTAGRDDTFPTVVPTANAVSWQYFAWMRQLATNCWRNFVERLEGVVDIASKGWLSSATSSAHASVRATNASASSR